MKTLYRNGDRVLGVDERNYIVGVERVAGAESKEPGKVSVCGESFHATLKGACLKFAEQEAIERCAESLDSFVAEYAKASKAIVDAIERTTT